jgi:hypothetical protein
MNRQLGEYTFIYNLMITKKFFEMIFGTPNWQTGSDISYLVQVLRRRVFE